MHRSANPVAASRLARALRVAVQGGIGIALALMLGGCATLNEAVAPDFGASMSKADELLDAGRADAAVLAWREVAAQFPASKEPWLEIARLRASQGRHVDALEAGEQVLRRDPTDAAAHELAIRSGLQVARRTMERLRAANAVPDPEVAETARLIALLMSDVFGPEFLVSDDFRKQIAREAIARDRALRVQQLPEASQEAPKGDPLDLLGGD